MDYDGKFYIGKRYDIKAKKTLDDLVLYDPDDLTTHGVVVVRYAATILSSVYSSASSRPSR